MPFNEFMITTMDSVPVEYDIFRPKLFLNGPKTYVKSLANIRVKTDDLLILKV